MLIIQHNCEQGYESIVIALEMALNIGIGLVCLQKPFLGNKDITYSAFNFYQPERVKANARVLIVAKKELGNKIIVENQIDLVDHPYFVTLDIQNIDEQSNRPKSRIKVINIYDNRVE